MSIQIEVNLLHTTNSVADSHLSDLTNNLRKTSQDIKKKIMHCFFFLPENLLIKFHPTF